MRKKKRGNSYKGLQIKWQQQPETVQTARTHRSANDKYFKQGCLLNSKHLSFTSLPSENGNRNISFHITQVAKTSSHLTFIQTGESVGSRLSHALHEKVRSRKAGSRETELRKILDTRPNNTFHYFTCLTSSCSKIYLCQTGQSNFEAADSPTCGNHRRKTQFQVM